MGISKDTIKTFCRAFQGLKLSGSCITFGVQGIDGSCDEIKEILETENYPLCELQAAEIKNDPATQFGDTLHQECFFRMLGFENVKSLDISETENPLYRIDLNHPVPKSLCSKFDFVYDGGTMEHCANPFQVLENASKLAVCDGIVCHEVPVSGYLDHAYYQFSPLLLFDFYLANGFEICTSMIEVSLPGRPVKRLTYNPADFYLPPDFEGGRACVFFAARKKMELRKTVIPSVSCGGASYFNRAEQLKICGMIRELAKSGPYVIYGAGSFSSCLIDLLIEKDLDLPECIIDDRPSVPDIKGVAVINTLSYEFDENTLVVLGSDTWQKKMRRNLGRLPVEPEIIDLYGNKKHLKI